MIVFSYLAVREATLEKITSLARDKIAKDLNLIDENTFAFCWITRLSNV